MNAKMPAKPACSNSRSVPLLPVCAVLAVVLLAALPSAAMGAQLHVFSEAFGEPGSGAGQVSLQAYKKEARASSGVAFDVENGDIYLADSGNHRVDEFEPDGTFVRAFGWEVDASSPEAKLQECTEVTGCQAGSSGSLPGQLGVPTYIAADNNPSSPSYGDLYVAGGVGVIGVDERQKVDVTGATGGTFTLTFEGQETAPIPYDASRREREVALEGLSTIGPGNVFATGEKVEFRRFLGEADLPQLEADGSGLQGAGALVEISTAHDGVTGVPETVTKYGPDGTLLAGWGESGQLSHSSPLATGTGRLSEGGAIGTGDIAAGSTRITNVNTQSGEFKVGQGLEGEGVGFQEGGFERSVNIITGVASGTLTLARPARGSGVGVALTTTNNIVSNLSPGTGAFEVGQEISAPGVPPGTRVDYTGSGYLALTKEATAAGTVALSGRQTFSPRTGFTTDPSGHLWAAAGNHAFRFDQSGPLLEQLHFATFSASPPARLAVSSSGDFFLASGFEDVEAFDPTGASLGTVVTAESDPSALAISPEGDLYVDSHGTSVLDISSQCRPVGTEANEHVCAPSQIFGAGHLAEGAGLAIAPDGTLYAASAGSSQIDVFGVPLEAQVQAALEVKTESAVLNATLNPKGGEVTTCFFQYGRSSSYGRRLPCLDESGEEVGTPSHPLTGEANVALHAEASGLAPGTTYHFRLRAVDAGGDEIRSEDAELETEALPVIEAAEATNVTATTALLKAKINPEGLAVSSCKVEWGTSTAYGNTLSCQPSSLPAGAEPVPVEADLSGLQGSTTYHWRVVAEVAGGGATRSADQTFVFLPGPPAAEVEQNCPNQAQREANGSTALPDCRAYELVTPPDRDGALFGYGFPLARGTVAASGPGLIAWTAQCFGATPGCGAARGKIGAAYRLARTGSGWTAEPVIAPASEFAGSTALVTSPESPEALFSTSPTPAPPTKAQEWFYQRHSDGSLSPLGPLAEQPGEVSESLIGDISMSSDFSHLVYLGHRQLWPSFDPATAAFWMYEYAGPSEHPFLVAVTGERGSNDLIGSCGVRSVGKEDPRGLSADGRIAYFVVGPCAGGAGVNAGVKVPVTAIYARIDGESGDARTVAITAFRPPGEECPAGGGAAEKACRERTSPSACGSGPAPAERSCREAAPAEPLFAGDSTDGSRFYFISTQQLTDEATDGSPNLYLYSNPQEDPLTGEHLTDVSAGDSSGEGPGVKGALAVSPEGNRIYFVATGDLAGVNAEGAEPEEGGDNLYVYDTEEERTRFIATLPGSGFLEVEQWEETGRIANVTAAGRFLLFTSRGALTPDATREGPEQVYRYDAQAEELMRVSIGQAGYHDSGNAGSGDAVIAPASLRITEQIGRPPLDPSMSADGRRVFFESPIGLTPGALNDQTVTGHGGVLAENVYEWEGEGVEGCTIAAGCVHLISDGRDVANERDRQSAVRLIGTDESGEDVYFSTADPLVPADSNTASDIYDARIHGGFAPPSTAVPCETSEVCHPGATSEGSGGSSGTSLFSGVEEGPNHPQNVKKTCPKGKILRHGRCVRKAHKKHHKRRAGNAKKGGRS